MILENLEVKHKSFGNGVVVSDQGKYIKIKFENTEKIFVYPDAFESFLTMADGTVPEDILSDIEANKRTKQAIIDKKNEENLRAMTKGIVIPGKEMTQMESDEDENRYKNQESEEI